MFNNLNFKNQCLCVLEAIHYITTNNTSVSCCVQTSEGGFLRVLGRGSCLPNFLSAVCLIWMGIKENGCSYHRLEKNYNREIKFIF